MICRLSITPPIHGVIPTYEDDGKVQLEQVDDKNSGIPLHRPLLHSKHPIQYSQLKTFLPESTHKTLIPACYCSQPSCSKLCFVILTDETQTLKLHAIDKTSLNYPSHSSLPGKQFTYLIPVPIHPGINIIFWCKQTIFFHPDKGYIHPPTFSISIPLVQLKVYHLSSQNTFIPSPEKFVYPFPLDDKIIPAVATVFSSGPPLWALTRLALGLSGVIPGGLGVDDKGDREAVPPHWWAVHRVQLTNFPPLNDQ